jgi:hypothetical protein
VTSCWSTGARARRSTSTRASSTGLRSDGLLGFREPSRPCDDAQVLDDAGFGEGRVWIVFTHQTGGGVSRLSRAETPRRVAAVADLQDVVEAPGAAAYLYVPRADSLARADRRPRSLPRARAPLPRRSSVDS